MFKQRSEKSLLLEEFRKCAKSLDQQKLCKWLRELGIGFTPLVRLPKQINPFDSRVGIYAKLEYTNYAESVKARTFSVMYYIKMVSQGITSKKKVVAATSGNFGLAGSYLLRENLDFTVYMSELAVKENIGLTTKLQQNETKIETFSDRYCPAVSAKRGMAIAAARSIEKIDSDVINFDQYDDSDNPLAHFLTTGPEIIDQTESKVTHFVTSLGTCGTMVGSGYSLKETLPKVNLIGLIPQEGHHQLGLRSKDELGAARFFEEAESLCNRIIEISDKEAYNNLLALWNVGVPAGVSSGTNVCGALKTAQELYDENKRGLVVTIVPDSCENYADFLRKHMRDINGVEFESLKEKYEQLKIKAQKEREEHVSLLKSGRMLSLWSEKAGRRY